MIIYKATNRKDGRVYIGQTSKTLNERIKSHRATCRATLKNRKAGASRFIDALILEGFESFDWEVLCDGITEKVELLMKEKEMIAHYDSTNRSLGYNILDSAFRPSFSTTIKYEMPRNRFYGKPVEASFSWTEETSQFENALIASKRLSLRFNRGIPVGTINLILAGKQKTIPFPTPPGEEKRRGFIRLLEDEELPQFYENLSREKEREKAELRKSREVVMTGNGRHYSERYYGEHQV